MSTEVDKTTLSDKVMKIISEQLGVDMNKIKLEARFVEELSADSLDMVELVMAFEEEFGIEISDENATKITTVRDAIKYITDNQQ